MARKKGSKPAQTGAERVRMYRQRNKLLQIQNERVNEKFENIRQNNNSVNVSPSSPSELESANEIGIANQIRIWASGHRISKTALNALLPILQSKGLCSLPKNYRTLQKTPTNIVIVNAAGGQLWHNSLRNSLIKVFSTISRDITIHLKFNMDGLPIYNSSKVTFWPILASIVGM